MLTSARRVLLLRVVGLKSSDRVYANDAPDDLAFVCALAHQCFLNEYVYPVDAREAQALTALLRSVDAQEAWSGDAGWNRLGVLACYVALHEIFPAERSWENAPAALQAVLREQLAEPLREQVVGAGLERLRPLQDAVSLNVQRQYEENPYPRWTRCVAAARDLIAARGHEGTPDGIRAARREIISLSMGGAAPELVSPASDFWTMSECRDLLFHVEEHRFTLLDTAAMFSRAGLQFLGLELQLPADRLRFTAEHSDPAALRSLPAWHAFGARHPETFGDTYRIWARRKPARSG